MSKTCPLLQLGSKGKCEHSAWNVSHFCLLPTLPKGWQLQGPSSPPLTSIQYSFSASSLSSVRLGAKANEARKDPVPAHHLVSECRETDRWVSTHKTTVCWENDKARSSRHNTGRDHAVSLQFKGCLRNCQISCLLLQTCIPLGTL